MKTGRKIIHGHHTRSGGRSKEWSAWDHMKRRCGNPNDASYKWHGAKGITVCDRWLHSFENFLQDVGLAPSPKHSLDRFPNQKGNYEPGNVRWATAKEQANNMSSNRIIEAFGQKRTVSQWGEVLGLNKGTIHTRLKLGWSDQDALSMSHRNSVATELPSGNRTPGK